MRITNGASASFLEDTAEGFIAPLSPIRAMRPAGEGRGRRKRRLGAGPVFFLVLERSLAGNRRARTSRFSVPFSFRGRGSRHGLSEGNVARGPRRARRNGRRARELVFHSPGRVGKSADWNRKSEEAKAERHGRCLLSFLDLLPLNLFPLNLFSLSLSLSHAGPPVRFIGKRLVLCTIQRRQRLLFLNYSQEARRKSET